MLEEAAVVGVYDGCGGCDGESVTMCWVIWVIVMAEVNHYNNITITTTS